jgi:hypothetical protein
MAHQEDSQCTKISPKLSLLSTKISPQILVAKLTHERAHERHERRRWKFWHNRLAMRIDDKMSGGGLNL